MFTRLRYSTITAETALKLLAVILMVMVITALTVGNLAFKMGSESVTPETEAQLATLNSLVIQKRDMLDAAKSQAEEGMDALAARLAELQTRLLRLEVVSERLVDTIDFDASEFIFDEMPAMGGATDVSVSTANAAELIANIEKFKSLLSSQDSRLEVLEEMLLLREVSKENIPSGLPVKSGYISSGFGGRVHPITGKYRGHQGVDIPGKTGEKIMAVASGVVIRSERATGYGKLVEIRHADGFSTRYAHNSKNLVKEGDIVDKGQVIALLGSTGQSTGPHVHFEVRHNKKPVNPVPFINKTHASLKLGNNSN